MADDTRGNLNVDNSIATRISGGWSWRNSAVVSSMAVLVLDSMLVFSGVLFSLMGVCAAL